MKKYYKAPEADIEEFDIKMNVFCTLSNEGGNDSGDTGGDDF